MERHVRDGDGALGHVVVGAAPADGVRKVVGACLRDEEVVHGRERDDLAVEVVAGHLRVTVGPGTTQRARARGVKVSEHGRGA
eukprot:2678481-Prymnesium_polylepis.2